VPSTDTSPDSLEADAMPILTNLDLIRVTGRFVTLDGHPAQGKIRFIPNTVVIDPATREVVLPVAFEAELDANGRIHTPAQGGEEGHLGIDLPSTNDPDLEPQGWTYQVTEAFGPATLKNRPTYQMQLPYDLAGGTFDLSEVSPGIPPSPGQVQYVTQAGFRAWVPSDGEVGQFLRRGEDGGEWVDVEPGGGVSQEYVDDAASSAVTVAAGYTDQELGSAVSSLQGQITSAQAAAVAAAASAALDTHIVYRAYDVAEEEWPARDAPTTAKVVWLGRGVEGLGPPAGAELRDEFWPELALEDEN
jgi:hypothetical protein